MSWFILFYLIRYISSVVSLFVYHLRNFYGSDVKDFYIFLLLSCYTRYSMLFELSTSLYVFKVRFVLIGFNSVVFCLSVLIFI